MAWIVLKNGRTFAGQLFGACQPSRGEFVFHTGMSGYQEILTDPSYARQVVVMTYPEIGNTGVNQEDMESRRCWLAGFVVRNLSPIVRHWRAEGDLNRWLADQGITGISGVDTRTLTLCLRDEGAMMGIISADVTPASALEQIADLPNLEGLDLVAEVTTPVEYDWRQGSWDNGYTEGTAAGRRIAVWDFGAKYTILRLLAARQCRVRVFPARTPLAEILAWQPEGLLLSNGPGDPRAVPDLVAAARSLIGKLPLFGICFGHQILGQALGGTIEKLKFGHHGANHPVRDEASGKVEITSQNHNYAVIPPRDDTVQVSQINLNDRSVEGILCPSRQVMGIQYHPESSPGPWDSRQIFDRFLATVGQGSTL